MKRWDWDYLEVPFNYIIAKEIIFGERWRINLLWRRNNTKFGSHWNEWMSWQDSPLQFAAHKRWFVRTSSKGKHKRYHNEWCLIWIYVLNNESATSPPMPCATHNWCLYIPGCVAGGARRLGANDINIYTQNFIFEDNSAKSYANIVHLSYFVSVSLLQFVPVWPHRRCPNKLSEQLHSIDKHVKRKEHSKRKSEIV